MPVASRYNERLLLAPAAQNISALLIPGASTLSLLGSHLTLHKASSVSLCVATQTPCATFQTLTLPSREPLRRYSPVSFQSSDVIQAGLLLGAVRFPTCSPWSMS